MIPKFNKKKKKKKKKYDVPAKSFYRTMRTRWVSCGGGARLLSVIIKGEKGGEWYLCTVKGVGMLSPPGFGPKQHIFIQVIQPLQMIQRNKVREKTSSYLEFSLVNII